MKIRPPGAATAAPRLPRAARVGGVVLTWVLGELHTADFADSSMVFTLTFLDHVAIHKAGDLFTGADVADQGYVVDQISGAVTRKVYQYYGRANPLLEFVKSHGRWHYRMDHAVAAAWRAVRTQLVRGLTLLGVIGNPGHRRCPVGTGAPAKPRPAEHAGQMVGDGARPPARPPESPRVVPAASRSAGLGFGAGRGSAGRARWRGACQMTTHRRP